MRSSRRRERRYGFKVSIQRLIGRLFGLRDRSARSAVRFPAFDTTGWRERQRSDKQVVWTNDEGDSIMVTVTVPGPSRPLSDEEGWRSECRPIAEDIGGAIISGDSFEQEPAPMFQFVYKKEDGNGYLYGGMLLIPRHDSMYVISSSCREHGVTGTREALVTAQLAEDGRLEIERFPKPDVTGAGGRVRNWFRDPYDPEYRGRVLRSMADDEKYDALSPHHPLSRLRRALCTVRRTLRFDA